MDFQKRTLSLRLPSGQSLDCSYSDDFEPLLLDNRREWVQVRGEAILNENNVLKGLYDVSEIIEVDVSPIIISSLLSPDGKELHCSGQPLIFEVRFDPEEGLYTAIGDIHMLAAGETRPEVEQAVADTLVSLWREYVMTDTNSLTGDALALRRRLTEAFAGADNAA